MADGSLEAEAFGRLIAEMRPRLHRYCARIVGSAFDGEDVVQEALVKAVEALPAVGLIERPESWLFRADERIVAILDFRYAAYVTESLALSL